MSDIAIERLSPAKWDLRFLELACVVGEWSKDPSTKVGAVITNGRRVVSLGFNGFPAGVDDLAERYADREVKYKMIVHAETNAIISARESLAGCTIYVSAPPCAACTGKIIQAGITQVFSVGLSETFHERWKTDLEAAATMLSEARVALIKLRPDWREYYQTFVPCSHPTIQIDALSDGFTADPSRRF
jgi:dCMP deaminase